MGKKMDALLGIGFKTSKFKSMVELVSERIAALEKQHRLRCLQSQSDIVALLKLGHQESALLRVETVITEQSTLDAYAMIENFCNLLVERVVLIEQNRECPDELKEAISSLIFAASKCGELQELGKISRMLMKRFGKEFASHAVDLCNNCGVSPKIVSKLSSQRPGLESKLTMLKDIALANDINLHFEGDQEKSHLVNGEMRMETKEEKHIVHQCEPQNDIEDRLSIEKKEHEKSAKEAMGTRRYKAFKAASRAAYKLATQAAIAAKAAVELSHPSEGGHHDHDLDHNHYDHDCPRKSVDKKHLAHFGHEASNSEPVVEGDETCAKVFSSSSPCRDEKIQTNHHEGHLKRD